MVRVRSGISEKLSGLLRANRPGLRASHSKLRRSGSAYWPIYSQTLCVRDRKVVFRKGLFRIYMERLFNRPIGRRFPEKPMNTGSEVGPIEM